MVDTLERGHTSAFSRKGSTPFTEQFMIEHSAMFEQMLTIIIQVWRLGQKGSMWSSVAKRSFVERRNGS